MTTLLLFASVLEKGRIGRSYNIGGENELTNLEIVEIICSILDNLRPRDKGKYRNLITFVTDRPGMMQDMQLTQAGSERELGWSPSETVESGMEKTVKWFLEMKIGGGL